MNICFAALCHPYLYHYATGTYLPSPPGLPHLAFPHTLMENAVDRAIRWLALAAALVSLIVYAIFYLM